MATPVNVISKADAKADAKTYATLRLLLGVLAVGLPFFLVIGNIIALGEREFQGSMSGYYYTDMRDVFVGTMASMGVFLIAYVGYDTDKDNIIGNIAGILAITVAFVPTTPVGAETNWKNVVHLLSAFMFFMLLAYYCLVLFRRTNRDLIDSELAEKNQVKRIWQEVRWKIQFDNPTANGQKIKRNRVYRVCGWTIVFSLGLLVVLLMVDRYLEDLDDLYYTLILEAIATFSFGFAWLVKSQSFPLGKYISLWRDVDGPSTE